MRNKAFKKIALMGRQRHNGIVETLLTLYRHLQTRDCQAVFEYETALHVSEQTLPNVPSDQLHKTSDLIIVVGGDGSLLHAAHIAVSQNLPVLGVNRGRLGFLTDIYPDELSKIDQVLAGEYSEEQRFLLSAQIMRNNQIIAQTQALNDIVLLPGAVVHMIEFNISINQQFVCHQRADGIIIATPTGSTAYALSGGGPILHPQLEAIVLVPMFPHTLTNRPIVVSADSLISIQISDNNDIAPSVSGDGQARIRIERGDSLHIRKHPTPLRLIHPIDYNYFQTLRTKLHWQSKG